MATAPLANFIKSEHCGKPGIGLRGHCVSCRTHRSWRDAAGAPEICPFGITLATAAAERAAALAAHSELHHPPSTIPHWPLGTWLSRILNPLARLFHINTSHCHCARRIATLNALGARLHALLFTPLKWPLKRH